MFKRLFQQLSDAIKRFFNWVVNINYKKLLLDAISFIGDIMHRALFEILLPKKYRTLTRKEIYTIIFKSDTPRGKKFDIFLLIAIGLNVLVMMMESLTGAPKWFTISMTVLEWLFTILFTFEFYLRIYCLERPRKYLVSFFGIIDIISIFPAYLSIFFPGASTLSVLRLMRVLRIFRIFKMQKFIDESRFLINSLRRSAIKILVLMIFVFIMAIILGAVMYGIEGGKNPAISSIPRGVYWAVVTITTVGYGDIAPVTAPGQFISTIVMLLGYSIIAVPTGIVAGDTIEEYREEKKRKKKPQYKDIEYADEGEDTIREDQPESHETEESDAYEDKQQSERSDANEEKSKSEDSDDSDANEEEPQNEGPNNKPTQQKKWVYDPGVKADPDDLL